MTFSASPLPPGLSLDASSGLISGTPSRAGVTSIVMDATNSAGTFSRTLTLTVTVDRPVVSLDAWRLANFGASVTDPTIAGNMADPDGDGCVNLAEFQYGSNPLDRTSMPTVGAQGARGDRKKR